MDIQVIFAQMLMLFAMMLTGYFIWKKEWFDDAAYQKLSKIVVNILNPILVIYGVVGKESGGDAGLVLLNLCFVALFYIILILTGLLFVLVFRPVKSERRLYRLMTIFPNVGFMGIPVISAVFGPESMIYIVLYMLGYNLILYTYGLALARKAAEDAGSAAEQSESQWKRMINPGMLASVAAVVIFLLKIPLPKPAVNFCDYMGNATIPLSMLLIGMSIAKADLKKIFSNGKIYAYTAVKMLLLPVLMIFLFRPFSVNPVIFGVFILQLAMPVGSIVTLVAKESGADETLCTNGIVLSTLASILTIPLVCMFL